jgi:hypothetical protein
LVGRTSTISGSTTVATPLRAPPSQTYTTSWDITAAQRIRSSTRPVGGLVRSATRGPTSGVHSSFQPAQSKRWVVVSPPGAKECHILLARAVDEHQATRVGDQTGGRVFLFLYTDDFWRDFNAYTSQGVRFIREPRTEAYGTVAVFEDLYGNQWDLLQPAPSPAADRCLTPRAS